MSDDPLYDSLREYEGLPTAASAQGKDPVNEPMIRHWCEALGHPVPPGGSAPATMLQVWTMSGLSGKARRAGPYDALLSALESAGYTSVVATDCEQEYVRELHPGDGITFDAVVESVSPRKTTKLGTGYFVTTRMDIRADGEQAGTHRFRILKFRPADGGKKSGPGGPARDKSATGTAATGTAATGTAATGTAATGTAATGTVATGTVGTGKAGSGRRPRPVVNRDNAGFWEGVARHKLLFQRCETCATPRLPWLPGCHACGSSAWTAVESAGHGTVYSYVVMHHPAFPAFDPPYAVALVELGEGVRLVSNITGVPCEKVRIGMPVELEFLRVDDDLELPVFRGAA